MRRERRARCEGDLLRYLPREGLKVTAQRRVKIEPSCAARDAVFRRLLRGGAWLRGDGSLLIVRADGMGIRVVREQTPR